jgi:hypothetical protein
MALSRKLSHLLALLIVLLAILLGGGASLFTRSRWRP